MIQLSQAAVTQSAQSSTTVTKKVVAQPEYNPDYDLDALQKQKEDEIAGYVSQLNDIKQ